MGSDDRLRRFAVVYARLALGAAFLSAVASRFGLWGGGSWDGFMRYAAQVNSFAPAFAIPVLAVSATIAELTLGLALVTGFQLPRVAVAASALLAVFGTAMAISFGVKEPLDYSVFSASAGALLLALWR
jgi:putative oxidoreductase